MTEQFNASPQPTLGVEWELALVDPDSRDLVPEAAEVIAAAEKADPDIHLEKEFLQNTIEMVTGVCTTTGEAVSELARDLRAIHKAADDRGLKLFGSGSHPFSDVRHQPVSDKGSYAEIIERTRWWGQQMLIWGVHVHVGIGDRDRVWPVINALTTYYPHLLALTASSPGWDGEDTGYASNRTMLYQQLPTAGLPPQFTTWDEWESYMDDQSISGVINHTGSMHFDIRPAGQWGTIEVRVSDATSNLRELAGLVALTHCLTVYLDRQVASGETPMVLQPWHVEENKWRGARYGLDALVITNRKTEEAWVRDEIAQLVDTLTPIAKEFHCEAELRSVLEILDRGALYQRQRKLYERTGSWLEVVDATCAELNQLTWP